MLWKLNTRFASRWLLLLLFYQELYELHCYIAHTEQERTRGIVANKVNAIECGGEDEEKHRVVSWNRLERPFDRYAVKSSCSSNSKTTEAAMHKVWQCARTCLHSPKQTNKETNKPSENERMQMQMQYENQTL